MSTDDNPPKPAPPNKAIPSTDSRDEGRRLAGETDDAREAARRAAEAIGLAPSDWLNAAIEEERAARAAAKSEAPDTGEHANPSLPAEAERAAAEAAAAAGVPVKAWLAQLLKEASQEENRAGRAGPPDGPPEGDIGSSSETDDAMETAARQASAAGVPMSAWLNAVIREASEGTAHGAPADVPPASLRSAAEDATGQASLALSLRRVPIGTLTAGPFQMRGGIDAEELASLAASIRSRGVLNPIIVRERPGAEVSYEIIAGERRWRAAIEAGLADVPVLVLDVPDRDAMEIALVENLQRHDLSPLEEAEGYRRLVEDLGETQDNLARVIGKSRSHIANTLRLLRLPEPVKKMMADGKLSAGHARAVLAARDPEGLALRAVESALTVRETERLAQGHSAPEHAPRRGGAEKDPDLEQIEAELSRLFGVAVKIALRGTGDRGTLTVRFNGLEKLHELIERLRT